MSNCVHCGAEIPEGATYCSACGASQQFYQQYPQQPYQQPNQQLNQQPVYVYQQTAPVNDSGSFGWAVLGFFIPIVGLVLFLVWRREKPRCAKMAGMGALVSVIVSVLFNMISACAVVLAASS